MAVKTRARKLPDGVDVIPSGRLRARYWCRGCSRHPKRGQHSTTFAPNEVRKADAWLRQERAQVDMGRFVAADDKTTVAEWAARWVKARAVGKRKNTVTTYRVVLHHIEGSDLGGMRIGKVKPMDVQEWVNGITAGANTTRGYYRLLRSIFGSAVDNELILKTPCIRIELGAKTRTQHVDLTTADIGKLVATISGRYRALVELQETYGPRIGECFGVKVDDINAEDSTLTIQRQLLMDSRLGPVKNHETHGVRTFTIGASTIETLLDQIATYPPCTKAGKRGCCAARKPCPEHDFRGLIFTTSWGNPVGYDVFLDRIFKPAVRRADLPEETGTHDLRHHAGSVMVDLGIPIPVVAYILGHSEAECVKTYLHPANGGINRAAQVIEAAKHAARKENGRKVIPLRPRRRMAR